MSTCDVIKQSGNTETVLACCGASINQFRLKLADTSLPESGKLRGLGSTPTRYFDSAVIKGFLHQPTDGQVPVDPQIVIIIVSELLGVSGVVQVSTIQDKNWFILDIHCSTDTLLLTNVAEGATLSSRFENENSQFATDY